MVPRSSNEPRIAPGKWVGLVFSSALIGLMLAVGALLLSPTADLRVEGSQFQIREGGGRVVGSALELTGPGPNGQVMALVGLADIPAYRYGSVSLQVSGLEGASAPAVFWIARTAPKDAHPRPLSEAEVRSGQIALTADERWRGDMMAFGLVARGPLQGPIRLQSVEFVPAALGWEQVLSVMGRNWAHLEGWSGGSVNFHVGALRNERWLTPVVMAALWAAFALGALLVLGVLVTRRLRWRHWSLSLLLAWLGGWLLLDLRWQAELVNRARQTLAAEGAAPDVAQQRALVSMREKITEPNARVIVVSDDVVSYATHRARYHLLPLRSSFGVERLPRGDQVRPGDYLLLISYRGPIRFDSAAGLLTTGESTLRVELLARTPEAGALFRIISGG